MTQILIYFGIPLIIIALIYFVISIYQAVEMSLNKSDADVSENDEESYITLKKSELSELLDENRILEKIIISALDKTQKGNMQLDSILNIEQYANIERGESFSSAKNKYSEDVPRFENSFN